MNICRLALIAFSLSLLVACGGGGSSSTAAARMTGTDDSDMGGGGEPTVSENLPDPLIADASVARKHVEAQQIDPSLMGMGITATPTDSTLTSEMIQKTFEDRAMDANTLMASDAFFTTPNMPQGTDANSDSVVIGDITFRGHLVDIRKGIADRFKLEMVESLYTPVMVHRGRATLAQYQAAGRINENENLEYLSYGGWLTNSAFSVDMLTINDGSDDESSLLVGISYGEASGSRPTGGGSAAWRGSVVGIVKNSGDVIQGDADILIRNIATNTLINSIDFSRLVNLNSGVPISDMEWMGVPTTNEGTFTSTTGGEIDGTFYGDMHTEVGGTFDRDGIIGAFGGVRQ